MLQSREESLWATKDAEHPIDTLWSSVLFPLSSCQESSQLSDHTLSVGPFREHCLKNCPASVLQSWNKVKKPFNPQIENDNDKESWLDAWVNGLICSGVICMTTCRLPMVVIQVIDSLIDKHSAGQMLIVAGHLGLSAEVNRLLPHLPFPLPFKRPFLPLSISLTRLTVLWTPVMPAEWQTSLHLSRVLSTWWSVTSLRYLFYTDCQLDVPFMQADRSLLFWLDD